MRKDGFIVRLNNEALLSGIKRVVANERHVQCLFLIYLAEIEKRKIYAKEGYSSLFRFVTEALGFSEGSALKRIWVARAARKFPLIYYLIDEGKISLTVLSKLCPYLSQGNVDRLLSCAENKSVRDVEKIIATHFPKSEVKDSIRKAVSPLSIDKVHIHFTADTQFAEDLEKAKSLLSHKYPDGKLSDILGEALRLLLTKIEPKQSEREAQSKPSEDKTRTIPRAIKNEVWHRDSAQCTFKSPSGKQCGETRFLEYDHKQPFALGGSSHSPGNVRLLCRTHNKLMAEQFFGEDWMAKKIRAQELWEEMRQREKSIPPPFQNHEGSIAEGRA